MPAFWRSLGLPWLRDLLPRLLDLTDRVVLGTDFPNTPYAYSHQPAALARLELGDARGFAAYRMTTVPG